MKTIVTLTMNPAVDMFLEVSRVVPDRKLRCPSPLWTPGGGGINVCRAIRHLGRTSTALFPGGGSSGDRLVMLLQRESIKINVIRASQLLRDRRQS
jgi:6-phosphofructokinase 2